MLYSFRAYDLSAKESSCIFEVKGACISQEASSSTETKEEQSHIIAQSSQTLTGQPQKVYRHAHNDFFMHYIHAARNPVEAL